MQVRIQINTSGNNNGCLKIISAISEAMNVGFFHALIF